MLNFVCIKDGWVCEQLANNFAEVCRDFGERANVAPFAIPGVTNIWMPYYLMQKENGDLIKTKRDVALFTHREIPRCEKSRAKADCFDKVAWHADVLWAMSNATAPLLEFTGKIPLVIEPPADFKFHKRELVLGVCGVEQKFNRKRLDCLERIRAIPGVRVEFSGGRVLGENMPSWFANIDYLLVVSENEGGPMPVKEAIAMHKPVIAPDVGWCWEYPCIEYLNFEHLERIVRQLAPEPRMEWKEAAQKLIVACRSEKENIKWLI